MKHSQRCERASPKSVCKCKCGGRLHGVAHKNNSTTSWVRTINSNVGGRAGKVIDKLTGKKFQCSCNTTFTINHFLAYDHDGGYEDSKNNKWWVFVECPNCHYQWSADKLLARISTLEEWL